MLELLEWFAEGLVLITANEINWIIMQYIFLNIIIILI